LTGRIRITMADQLCFVVTAHMNRNRIFDLVAGFSPTCTRNRSRSDVGNQTVLRRYLEPSISASRVNERKYSLSSKVAPLR
jgi:hypothetical protein